MISFHSHKFKRNVYCFARFCSSNHSLCYIRIYCRHIIIHRFVPSFLLYYGPGKYTSSYTRHFSSARRYCFYLLIVNISCLQLIVQLCQLFSTHYTFSFVFCVFFLLRSFFFVLIEKSLIFSICRHMEMCVYCTHALLSYELDYSNASFQFSHIVLTIKLKLVKLMRTNESFER